MELGAISGSYLGIDSHVGGNKVLGFGSFKDFFDDAFFRHGLRGSSTMLSDSSSGNSSGNSKVDKRLMGICYEFESILVNRVFKEMRDSVESKSSLLYGGHAEDIFKDMLYERYSLDVARGRGFGLAKEIYNQLVQ